MFNKYGMTVVLSSILAMAAPIIASARDRDGNQSWQNNSQSNSRVSQPYVAQPGYGIGQGYVNTRGGYENNAYANGGYTNTGYANGGYGFRSTSRGYEERRDRDRDNRARMHIRWDSRHEHDRDWR
jgi:hypothetical protein